ncbi:MAG: hypothetical protein EOO92_04095 [Pedobacter sp.]|nr:MAG: hypothetical protein EOO92_04095 [Pedobacter sp.]
MARVEGKFLKGVVANVVLKKHRGEQIIQSKPHLPKSRMTKPSLKSAGFFGVASNFAASIRTSLSEIISSKPEGTLNYRLNSQIVDCLKMARNNQTEVLEFEEDSFSSLAGFEINDDSPVRKSLFMQPKVFISGNFLQIQVPDVNIPGDIKFPKDATLCKFVMCVTMFDLKNGKWTTLPMQLLDIPESYDPIVVPAQDFTFDIQPGCLCITTISLQYFESTFVGMVGLNSKTFNPAAILNAHITSGEPDLEAEKNWSEMDFKTL